MEPEEEQLGTLPLSVLVGRKSRSAEAALRRQILAERAMTPMERVLLAIRLGQVGREVAPNSAQSGGASSSRKSDG